MTLDDLLEQLAPDVANAFRAAIQDITDNALLMQIIEAIERNDIEGAFRALGFDPASFNGFTAALRSAFEAGATAMLTTLPKYISGADGIKTIIRFNMRDPRAEQWLQQQSSSLITNIEADVRNAVRNTLQAGLAEGRNPRNVALDIVGRYDRSTGHREGGAVGLGEREETWSRSARQRLLTLDDGYFTLALRDKRFDATVRAAIDAGKPLPLDTVDKLVDRYRANALRHRGETIGRTETLSALNTSQHEATIQALQRSDLPMSAGKKTWKTAMDNRVRHDHREMQNVTVGIDEPFMLPDGSQMMFPTDTSLGAAPKETILCRCRAQYTIDFEARLRGGG